MSDTEFLGAPDPSVLSAIALRLYPDTPNGQLALEVVDGPYQGVIYSYINFRLVPGTLDEGMVGVRYDVQIHAPAAFTQTEAFDAFCTDVLIAWITRDTDMTVNGTPVQSPLRQHLESLDADSN